MAIIANNTELVADLDALTTASQQLMQDDNELKPLQHNVNFIFHNLVNGTTALRRRAIWVPPYDYYLEALAVQASDVTAGSTVEAAVTAGRLANGQRVMTEDLGDNVDHGEENGLVVWPVKVKQVAGFAGPPGKTKIARLFLDNTKTKPGLNFATTSRAFRLLPRGSTVMVSARALNNVAAVSMVQVTLVLRSFWARE